MIRMMLLIVATVLAVAGCREQLESRYPTADAAAQAGAFQRGWLPAVLQPDATEIQEWHDFDSNKVRGRFALNASVLNRLQRDCQQSQEKPPLGTGPTWWLQTDVGKPSMTQLQVVRCDDFFVLTDRGNRVGYFWESRR